MSKRQYGRRKTGKEELKKGSRIIYVFDITCWKKGSIRQVPDGE